MKLNNNSRLALRAYGANEDRKCGTKPAPNTHGSRKTPPGGPVRVFVLAPRLSSFRCGPI
jgi:hypothetical protein